MSPCVQGQRFRWLEGWEEAARWEGPGGGAPGGEKAKGLGGRRIIRDLVGSPSTKGVRQATSRQCAPPGASGRAPRISRLGGWSKNEKRTRGAADCVQGSRVMRSPLVVLFPPQRRCGGERGGADGSGVGPRRLVSPAGSTAGRPTTATTTRTGTGTIPSQI